MLTSQPSFDKFLLVPENAGEKLGGTSLGSGGYLYPCVWPSVSPPCYPRKLYGGCGQSEWQCLELI